MTKHEYSEGQCLFREGDPSHFVCRIVSGEIELTKILENQTVVIGKASTGEFVGEMGVIDGRNRSATASAISDVTAELLSKEEFLRLMSEDSESAHQLIIRLSERLRITDQKLVEATVAKDVRTYTLAEPAIDDPKNSAPARGLTVFEGSQVGTNDRGLKLFPNSEFVSPFISLEGLEVTEFPFNVGRKPQPQEPDPPIGINLSLPDQVPFRLSRMHFSLEQGPQGYRVRDLGSKLGTQVNGEYLGHHFAHDGSNLKPGENLIIAGGLGSRFAFRICID